MSRAIDIKNISKRFGNTEALAEISMSIESGCIFGLLGANGAGKTTLLRIINQITPPDSGDIVFNIESSHMGYLPEERGLYPEMKVADQLLFFARLRGMTKEAAQSVINQYLCTFELAHTAQKETGMLSKGTQQKIQFIATILHHPSLLILDEPFSGLDPLSAQQMKNEIVRLNGEGTTFIISTHDLNSVEELCTHIAMIDNGKMVLQGKLADLKQQYKKNIFSVITDTSIETEGIDGFEKIQSRRIAEGYETIFAQTTLGIGNELLKQIIPQALIISYHEQLPVMQDIFIETINRSNHE